jgi:rhodanese-related sulfurtransferase
MEAFMKDISVTELKQMIPGIKIIDIRDDYQFNMGSLPTSINIPTNFLLTNPDIYLNKNSTYYLYCEYGTTSQKVCNQLSNKGYNVINILGGFSEYKLK